MKIIYLAISILPSTRANSIHVMRMCNAFAENGNDTTLVVPWRLDNLLIPSKKIHQIYGTNGQFKIVKIPLLPTMMGYYLFGILSAIYCKIKAPTICYGRALSSVSYALRLGLNTIYESHTPEYLDKRSNKTFNKIFKNPKLKRVVLISDALKKIFIDHYGEDNRFYVAHDGADLSNELKQAIPNDDNTFKIGYTGHLYSGRGIELIIELSKRCQWAIFHIIGGNKEDVEQRKKETATYDNITFHGFIQPSDVAKYINSFDILLAPYQKKVTILNQGNTASWMSPLKIFEYMASGIPLISSNLFVLREVLEHKKNCLLCDAENIDEWEEAINLLKNDKELRNRLTSNARGDIANKYSWKNRAKNVINL